MTLRMFLAVGVILLLAGCSDNGGSGPFYGYFEGQYVAVAPEEPGRIVEIAVTRGARVKAGQLVARLDESTARLSVEAAKADLERAEANLANLESGSRREEISVTEAELAEAQATLAEATQQLDRQKQLFERKIVSQSLLDSAQAAHDSAAARVAALEQKIAVQKLPARAYLINAARSQVAANRAQLEQAEWKLAQRQLLAPADGLVDEVLRRVGEMAAPERPVLSLLPDGNRIVRFFVPEEIRKDLQPGNQVSLSCTGCPEGLTGTITHVAAEPEYTPPVIYSVESREKLVYLVEAEPADVARRFTPGQVVDVSLIAGTGP